MLPEWIDKVIAGGPAVIFAFLWWTERGERIKATDKLEHMTERVIVAMTETKGSLQTFSNLLTAPGRSVPGRKSS